MLAIERELNQVRSDIESMDGQMRLYDKQVAMSTLVVSLVTIRSEQLFQRTGRCVRSWLDPAPAVVSVSGQWMGRHPVRRCNFLVVPSLAQEPASFLTGWSIAHTIAVFEPVLSFLVAWHNSFHLFPESIRMIHFDQMCELVDDHIIKDKGWSEQETG